MEGAMADYRALILKIKMCASVGGRIGFLEYYAEDEVF